MKNYANVSNSSGVVAYEYGRDWISVLFRGRVIYTYSYRSAGKQHVDSMKKLADSGKGLSTYISQHVKDLYER